MELTPEMLAVLEMSLRLEICAHEAEHGNPPGQFTWDSLRRLSIAEGEFWDSIRRLPADQRAAIMGEAVPHV